MIEAQNKSENYDTITVLYRQINQWFYQDRTNLNIELIDNIDTFLLENLQFVRINENYIINLNHLEDYSLKGSECFFIVTKIHYKIEGHYIGKVKAALKSFQKRTGVAVLPSSMKGLWLHKLRQNQPDKSIGELIDAINIKYMLRIGTRTYIYYENEKKRHFYETLKYFERNLNINIPLVRVDRNCIINLTYLNSYMVYTQSKTGEVSIDDHLFKISRRQLGSFRKKVKDNCLVFAIQKLIE